MSPQQLLGEEIMLQLDNLAAVHFGKGVKRLKRGPYELNWTKKKYLLQSFLLVILGT